MQGDADVPGAAGCRSLLPSGYDAASVATHGQIRGLGYGFGLCLDVGLVPGLERGRESALSGVWTRNEGVENSL